MARFNVPPGWPEPPQGWLPPDDWTPPSHWPQPPAGWQLVVGDLEPAPMATAEATPVVTRRDGRASATRRRDAEAPPARRDRSLVGAGVTSTLLATLVVGRVLTLGGGATDLHLPTSSAVMAQAGLSGASASANPAPVGADATVAPTPSTSTSSTWTSSTSTSSASAAPAAIQVTMTCPGEPVATGAAVTFGHTVMTPSPYRAVIDYGDGRSYTGTSARPGAVFSHTYSTAGTHLVQVRVTSSAGLTGAASCRVVVGASSHAASTPASGPSSSPSSNTAAPAGDVTRCRDSEYTLSLRWMPCAKDGRVIEGA